ncbi:ABC transporter permease [Celerinatantimonas diazotrophica]|uniref:Peptide/nickel transport system permease protein n=1 Tax=Celerinatantimonas diazotrophica TaxID=412034 RepID=A0A4R1KAQ5_9GAMM|nr:ABC transporter permease [Celerinatantimonas diazotrophica]TCK61484.1 peptide/nickel transport system permease protein [Celerinatantimonas diazotrophica]CAG9296947.1 Glutathione transport system permease protein GsiD [Celerinatantimonas diazotrophica]
MTTSESAQAIKVLKPKRWYRSFELTVGALLTSVMLVVVLISPWLYPNGGSQIDLMHRLQAPFSSVTHILGTDPLGRDILARVIVGGQVSLLIGFTSVAGSLVLGAIIGLIAGFYRGFWDMFLMRFADVQLALPFILLAITFTAIVGSSIGFLILFMIMAQWVQYARVIRGSVLSLREREFVQAARASAIPTHLIIIRHILPNCFGPVLILTMLNIGNNILLASSLSFLGLGVDPSVASWGGMLADGRTYMQTAWWVCVFPGLAIMLTVLGMNLLGDWLRDRLDPNFH